MPKIDALYAWVATEKDGGEGVIGMKTSGGWMPLVGADRARIESLRDYAQSMVDQFGIPIRLVRFTEKVEMGTLVRTKPH